MFLISSLFTSGLNNPRLRHIEKGSSFKVLGHPDKKLKDIIFNVFEMKADGFFGRHRRAKLALFGPNHFLAEEPAGMFRGLVGFLENIRLERTLFGRARLVDSQTGKAYRLRLVG